MSKSKPPQRYFNPDEANAWAKKLLEETDRGAALITVAYLDRRLEDLIRAGMAEGNEAAKAAEKLLKYPGFLSTFASRIDLAYALGWIGPQVYADLTKIRKIRNEFAHPLETITFDDQAVRINAEG
jgi:DNA-binding MltR family transcriptional regulator